MKRGKKCQKRRRRFPLAVCLLSAICALTGCGGEEQEIQEQMPSYVYVAEQLVTSSAGGYRLPDHFCKPAVADGQLYFMKQGYDVQTVERTALPENGVAVKIDDIDVILCLSVSAIETEKDRGTGEEEILELLDMAMEAGAVSDGTEGGGTVCVDPGKDYCRFSLLDYAVDQEQNAYFLIEYSSGGYYAMESMGCVLCRRDAGGEWVYRRFFPALVPLSDSLAADGNGGFYLLTAEGILAVDESGRKTGRVDTEIFRGASYSSERLVGNADGHAYYFVFEEFDSRWKGMEVENQRGIRLLLGYPTVDGRGTAALRIEAPLGIVAGAGNREGAWEFLEYYTTDRLDLQWCPRESTWLAVCSRVTLQI